MQVLPHRPEFAADFLEQRAHLLADGSAARRDHFRDQDAGEDAVFFGDVAANGEAGAFFTAESDFVFADELADIFEADGSLVRRLAVRTSGGVEELRCGDAAGCGHFPAARFYEIVVDECENVIWLDPGAVAIDDAEAVGVSVGGEAGEGAGVAHGVAERDEIFFGHVGAGAVEEAIAVGANGLRGYAVIGENFVEISGAAAVECVEYEFDSGLAEHIEADQFGEALEVGFAEADFFSGGGLGGRWLWRSSGERGVFLD